VNSPQEMREVMKSGSGNRSVAATRMNATSSRSHSLFCMKINKKNLELDEQTESRLYFVDLAGSEKIAKTNVVGKQLEEAKNINKSLTTLGLVINALVEGSSRTHTASKFVPYRNSKLTRILQESIGGNSLTTLVIACSMCSYNEKETLSTMQFGQRAKSIKNKVKANVERSAKELERLLNLAELKIKEYEKLIKKIGGDPSVINNLLKIEEKAEPAVVEDEAQESDDEHSDTDNRSNLSKGKQDDPNFKPCRKLSKDASTQIIVESLEKGNQADLSKEISTRQGGELKMPTEIRDSGTSPMRNDRNFGDLKEGKAQDEDCSDANDNQQAKSESEDELKILETMNSEEELEYLERLEEEALKKLQEEEDRLKKKKQESVLKETVVTVSPSKIHLNLTFKEDLVDKRVIEVLPAFDVQTNKNHSASFISHAFKIIDKNMEIKKLEDENEALRQEVKCRKEEAEGLNDRYLDSMEALKYIQGNCKSFVNQIQLGLENLLISNNDRNLRLGRVGREIDELNLKLTFISNDSDLKILSCVTKEAERSESLQDLSKQICSP
jgi:hypothetical protein